MIRWLGGLIGGALAIGAIVLIVGVPSLVPSNVAPIEAPDVSPSASRESTPASLPVLPPAPDPIPVVAEEPVSEPASTPPAEPVEATLPEPAPVASAQASADTTDPQRWHAFWSPFRSQIAANGFVTQLQTVTGLDYRVVTVKPGVYEVAFGYHDDDEIAEHLAQISAATGLDVPGS